MLCNIVTFPRVGEVGSHISVCPTLLRPQGWAHGLRGWPGEASQDECVREPGSTGLLHPSTGSSQSSHTSKYFGSIDSSEAEAGSAQARTEPGDQVIKYVLQDPIWLLMANADQHVMMTYQVPSR